MHPPPYASLPVRVLGDLFSKALFTVAMQLMGILMDLKPILEGVLGREQRINMAEKEKFLSYIIHEVGTHTCIHTRARAHGPTPGHCSLALPSRGVRLPPGARAHEQPHAGGRVPQGPPRRR